MKNQATFKDLDVRHKRYLLAQNLALNTLVMLLVDREKADPDEFVKRFRQRAIEQANKAPIGLIEDFIIATEEVVNEKSIF
jgi:hypothetical protein